MTALPAAMVSSTPDGAGVRAACTHCGLDVPRGMVEVGSREQFCCNGCRAAYAVISGCGLEQYYRLARAAQDAPHKVAAISDRFTHFDDPEFLKLHARRLPGDLLSIDLAVENVHCMACVWLLEKLPTIVAGVRSAEVRIAPPGVRVVFDPAQVPLSRIAQTMASVGYPASAAREAGARDARRGEDRRRLIRLAIAGALAGNVMMFAFVLYGGVFVGIEPVYERLFRWLSAALGFASLAGPGSEFFLSAWRSIRMRVLNLDVPICLALAAGGVMGLVNVALERGELYFDSLSMLVFLLLVGRFLQHRQQRWATSSVEMLFNLVPRRATRISAKGPEIVPIEAIRRGDVLEVLAGDSFPADGVVEAGDSSVDLSLLTGETRPVHVTAGSPVHAATVNLGSRVLVRVSAAGAETRAARLMDLVSDSAARRAPIIRFTDRVASAFVVGVSIASAATLVLWLRLNPAVAIDHATSMLIVTCPCALGIAAPLVMAIAMGRGARRGVLIKGADVLESLSRPGVIVLDKTGTITCGRSAVVEIAGDRSALGAAAALERHSSHPVARAIVDAAGELSLTNAASEVEQRLGGGIAGLVDGRHVIVGTAALLAACEFHTPRELQLAAAQQVTRGLSPAFIGIDGVVCAVIGIGDPVRADSPAAIDELQARGWRVRVLSGDHPQIARAVAGSLNIAATDCAGGIGPEEKLAEITRLAALGPVVMVGDGVNDSAALAAATVGIAVHGGAEASLTAADVYLNRPGIMPLVELIDASRRAMRAVRRTLWASLGYNIFAGSLAIAGVIHPMVAAILMPVSSLTMLAIAIWSRTFPVGRGHA